MRPQQTVINGAGFTGLFTALYLSHYRYVGQITLIDQTERFVFKPLLYEFLNGQMETAQVCPRYQELLQGSGVAFVQDCVERVDFDDRKVELASGLQYTYDHLVLALGSTTGYFGIPGAAEHSFAFREIQDIHDLRYHLRQALQRARQTQDAQIRQKLLTAAVIGAGPTGVELAATLADWLPAWYEKLGGNPQEIRIVLVNRGSQILSGDANEHLRETALKLLQQRRVSVELLTDAAVTALSEGKVEYQAGDQVEALEAETIVWTAGTMNNPLLKKLAIPDEHRDRHGRPFVTPNLHLIDHPNVFAGGDCVTQIEPDPALAQVAYQQAKAIAHNIMAVSVGDVARVAHVSLRGTLMKLGAEEAAANIFDRYQLTGRVAHSIRHLTYLEMLPTPIHDLKITADWFSEEILQHTHGK